MFFGLLAIFFYATHTVLGNILWNEYNPITTDISALTAVGAPNAGLLNVFTAIYGFCSIFFVAGMLIRAFRKYNKLIKSGYLVLMFMEVVSLVGYKLFPLTSDKTVMTFQNKMHIVVTVIVVISTIVFSFLVATGYKKEETTKKFGKYLFVMAVLVTIFGLFNPIAMGMGLDVMGFTERLVVYTIQFLLFSIAIFESFTK
ncbi:DUF998 domain-containing protein [Chloroflexota bacterium]|nr:DUF998 domain-containing protein [Chloroflexota bacterium]